jgi:hypothetical protein
MVTFFRGFIVVAPSIIQPASIYSAIVWVSSIEDSPRLGNLLDAKTIEKGVHFRLALFKNGADIQASTAFIQPGTSDALKIQVIIHTFSHTYFEYQTLECTYF